MHSSGSMNKISVSSNLTRSHVWVWPRHVLAGELGWLAAPRGCHWHGLLAAEVWSLFLLLLTLPSAFISCPFHQAELWWVGLRTAAALATVAAEAAPGSSLSSTADHWNPSCFPLADP